MMPAHVAQAQAGPGRHMASPTPLPLARASRLPVTGPRGCDYSPTASAASHPVASSTTSARLPSTPSLPFGRASSCPRPSPFRSAGGNKTSRPPVPARARPRVSTRMAASTAPLPGPPLPLGTPERGGSL
ncbi:hypothetical protein BS50DRAFT_65535 [Corynespora cassiicola Philippines]|uniref:Uncharacterized protein n=1 Tax=Corynespora cassiicola Philippines TaxID=1448308 RepID=A0A2T2NFL1_CORCC|nr:hypothetical protein BS50DRAFT_65535 [Corynespora cassiicola Philippines]